MVEQKIEVPKYWRKIPEYYRLEAVKCLKCGKTYYPSRRVCRCSSRIFKKVRTSDVGKLINYTILHQVPVDYEKTKPLVIGLVDLGEIKVLTQLTDLIDIEKIRQGITVEKTFRIIKKDGMHGIITYGYKFCVVTSRS